MLTEDDGIVVPDGLDEKAFGVVGIGRSDYLQTRHRREHVVRRLRVLRSGGEPCADHASHHQRGSGLATEHVAELGSLVVERVVGDSEEVHEHQLCDRPQSGQCGSGSHSDDRGFGDRGIDYTLRSELRPQSLGDTQDTAKCLDLLRLQIGIGTGMPTPYVLTDENDARVALHFLGDGLFDGLAVGLLRHVLGFHACHLGLLSTTRRHRSADSRRVDTPRHAPSLPPRPPALATARPPRPDQRC